MSSGTKCINGEQLSLEGCVINDSHAEIVTRRCLVLYLYQQLILLSKELNGEFPEDEGEDVADESDEAFETAAAMEQIVENVLQEENRVEVTDLQEQEKGVEITAEEATGDESTLQGEQAAVEEEDADVEVVAKPKKRQKSIFKKNDDGEFE